MPFETTEVWPAIERRLEAGGRLTSAEAARLIRIDPSVPPNVMMWIADALEGKGKAGRPPRNSLDDLKNPIKMAALHVRWRRQFRRDNGLPTYRTLPEDILAAAQLSGVQAAQVAREYRR